MLSKSAGIVRNCVGRVRYCGVLPASRQVPTSAGHATFPSASLSVLHSDLEFAHERAALAQGNVAEKLELAIRKQLGAEEDVAAVAGLANVPGSIDPVQLLADFTDNDCPGGLPFTPVVELLVKIERTYEKLLSPVIEIPIPTQGRDPKLVVVGDIHGQLLDVLHVLHQHGPPSKSCTYLFNGDITDRGIHSVEVWMLVLSYKLRWPEHVHILRGNHENAQMNERPRKWGGGFADECFSKYGQYGNTIYNQFQRIFELLPLFAVLQGEVFVVHGGLFRTPGVTLQTLRDLPYRQHYPLELSEEERLDGFAWSAEEEILFDAQWADPQEEDGIKTSRRGKSAINFGPDVTEQFLDDNGLSLCIRSHQVPRSMRGYSLMHRSRLLTIFTASNYAGSLPNSGAVAVLRKCEPREFINDSFAFTLASGLHVQCEEHDISYEAASSPTLKQARSVVKVMREMSSFKADPINAVEKSMANVAQQALFLICLEREDLLARCQALDPRGEGVVSLHDFGKELTDVCGPLDWHAMIHHYMRLEPGMKLTRVSYQKFFNAISVRCQYLVPVQARSLAQAMLEAELNLEGLNALFDYDNDGFVTSREIRNSLRLLLPSLSDSQLQILQRLFGERSLTLGEVVERFLTFVGPLEVHEQDPLIHRALQQLGPLIQAWADIPCQHAALLRFFDTFDQDNDGILEKPELIDGLCALKFGTADGNEDSEPSREHFDIGRIRLLANALDTNNSGGVSFLELARAFQPADDTLLPLEVRQAVDDFKLETAEALEVLRQNSSCVALLFLHRPAIVRACRLLDTEGSGRVPVSRFAETVRTLGHICGRPFTDCQIRAIQTACGWEDELDYVAFLDGFEVVLDKSILR